MKQGRTTMNPRALKPGRLALCVVAGAILSLTACSDEAGNQSAERQVDSAVEKTKDATAAAARKAAELAEKARDNTKAYFESPDVKRDVEAAKDALKNAGDALTAKADDAAITASVTAALARDPELSARRIDVRTNAGAVQLAGPAPNTEAKARAETIARGVKGVSSVDNRLEVTATN
ncbi:BON domain-containing protein [Variovorax sp. MHTC-1]|nr:BON domain-containing protein [Variovorax sp. MHTC-1]